MQTSYELHAKVLTESKAQHERIERFDAIGVKFLGEFKRFEVDRRETENRLLHDLRQYHGIYEADVLEAIEDNKSKVFLKKTKVKVDTFKARAGDLLFPANKERNWEIDATPKPSVPPKVRAQIASALAQANGKKPTQTEVDEAVRQHVKASAEKMRELMDDQLTEAGYRGVAFDVIFDAGLYGTGLVKGPLFSTKTRKVYEWVEDEQPKKNWLLGVFGTGKKAGGRYELKTYTEPSMFVTRTPLWRWYPDMSVTRIEDMRAAWEHHRLTKNGLMDLARNKSFHSERILNYVKTLPLGFIEPRTYEHDLRTIGDRIQGFQRDVGLYDLYERWGWVDAEDLDACGIPGGDGSPVFCNLWVLPNGEVIKAVRQPINGMLYPWHAFYYRKDDTSIWGEGIAKMGRDDQDSINAAIRMLLNNAAITSGPQIEAFVDLLDTTEDPRNVYPGKVWLRKGSESQYSAVRSISLDSHMAELEKIIQLFDANFDETTALPKYLYGDNPTQGAAGTMGGLSMLMGNSNISLKDAVIGFDEGITRPLMTAWYSVNMQFHPDASVKGDFDVKARGATSLVAKEVRAQQLMQFGATMQPEERLFAKWRELLEAKAVALDLGDFVMSENEADAQGQSPEAQQQAQMAQMQAQLALAEMQARVQELQAKVAKLMADTEKVKAETVETKVQAAYEGMQAGGVAATTPNAAVAGDEILRSAGWQDATPQEGTPQTGAQVPQMQDAGTGMQAGIETQQIEGAAQ